MVIFCFDGADASTKCPFVFFFKDIIEIKLGNLLGMQMTWKLMYIKSNPVKIHALNSPLFFYNMNTWLNINT